MGHGTEGLEGVQIYVDEIIIWGSIMQEHKESKVPERVHKYRLGKSKCQFDVQEIVFFGDKLTAQGVQPDQEKVKAALNIPKPTEEIGVISEWAMTERWVTMK